MRIVLLQTQAENAGAQEISRILASSLLARGYDVHQVFFFRRTDGFDDEPNVHFCTRQRPSNPLQLVFLLWRIFATLRRIRPDVVLTFQHFGNLIGAPMARIAGVGRVMINQNTAASMMPPLVKWLDKGLGVSGLVEAVVVNSARTLTEYERHPAAYRRRLIRIDHGFMPKTTSMSKKDARAIPGLPSDATLLGCVARLHSQKHLDAAIKVLTRDQSWHLALAGQGPAKGMLLEIVRSLDCEERVHFIGELAPHDVGTFLGALDVFVFPSVAETFGLAVVEAAQAGVPVVANALPVLEEVLCVDGEPCAIFVDVDDAGAFGGAVRSALGNAPLTHEFARRGRLLAQRYPPHRMVDLYQDAIERPRSTGASNTADEAGPSAPRGGVRSMRTGNLPRHSPKRRRTYR